MLYDKEKKLLFIHIPKNGGNSVERAIGMERMAELAKHSQITDVEPIIKIDQYYKFAVIRNPWDRVVSMYYFLNKHGATRNMSFKSWLLANNTTAQSVRVMAGLPNPDKKIHGYYDAPLQTKTQLSWLKTLDGNIAIDFVCRLEHLNDDMAELCKIKNLNSQQIQFLNKTEHPKYNNVHDQETIDFVGQHYREDIDFFGFDISGHATKNIGARSNMI